MDDNMVFVWVIIMMVRMITRVYVVYTRISLRMQALVPVTIHHTPDGSSSIDLFFTTLIFQAPYFLFDLFVNFILCLICLLIFISNLQCVFFVFTSF